MSKQHEILKGVLPAYRAAAERGSVELSATPYYHPILPLVCDTNAGRESVPGLPLPNERFRRPDDAGGADPARPGFARARLSGCVRWECGRAKARSPMRCWALPSQLGVQWMASDEGVLGRSLGHEMSRDSDGYLDRSSAEKLYNIYRWEREGQAMNMVFRDHRISDLLGFVYAGMRASEAAAHLLNNIKRAAAPVLDSGRDAVLSIILDGENAWESYEGNGREFLRRFYEQPAEGAADRADHDLRGDCAAAAGELRQAARPGSRLLDQCQFQCLDWRAGGQQGVGLPEPGARFL